METILHIFGQSAETLPFSGLLAEASKDALILLVGVIAAYSLRIIVHLLFHNALLKR